MSVIRYTVVFEDGQIEKIDVSEVECRGSDQVARLIIGRKVRAGRTPHRGIKSVRRTLPGDDTYQL